MEDVTRGAAVEEMGQPSVTAGEAIVWQVMASLVKV